MRWPLLVVLLGACSPPGDVPDASDDAGFDKKVPPMFDAGDAAITGPGELSATGLYADFASRTLAAGIVAYEPRWPLWSDGLEKKRWLLLPSGQSIDTSSTDDWTFPVGTKIWKEFSQNGTVIETRLLWKKPEGWFEMAYAWLADGSDAVAAPSGVKNALGTGHDVPSQNDCNACHANVSDVIIGVSAFQLAASDGDGTLAKLPVTKPIATIDAPGAGVVKDALGYLHGNCGHCHNDISSLRNQTALRLRLLSSDHSPADTGAYRTAPFLVMKHPIPPNDIRYALVPGAPDQSGVAVRMALRGTEGDDAGNPFQMPPVCTSVIDDAGVATVRAWIASLPCNEAPCWSAPAP